MGNVRKNPVDSQERKVILRTIFCLAWPAFLEQILQTIVQYIDTAMVGRIGAHASASVGLTGAMSWLVISVLLAFGIGILSCVAEAIGAGKPELARRYGIQSLYFTIILGVVLGAVMLGISPHLPRWLGADPAIQKEASLYFGIVCTPMIFRASSAILGSAMRGAGDTKSPMIANVLMNITNIILNFFLIYESRKIMLMGIGIHMPGAGLGVVGAAIATAISYCVGGIFMFAAYWKNPILSPKGEKMLFEKSLSSKCLSIAIPVTMERLSTCLGQVVFTFLVTSLGTVALATHSIAITAEQAFYIPCYGMRTAASTMAGNALGEKNPKKFSQITGIIQGITVIMMTLTGLALFLIPGPTMSIFTTDAAVIAGGIIVLRIVAVSEPMYGAVIVFDGLFNGIGDTKVPFFISVFCMWVMRIAMTSLFIYVFHAGLEMVWVCMVADNVTRCILLCIRFYKGSWKKKFVY